VRRQDEILTYFPAASADGKNVLLDLAGDINPAADSGRLEELLVSCLAATDPAMRTIGTLSLRAFLSTWVPASYGVASLVAGTWTQLYKGARVASRDPPSLLGLARWRALQQCLIQRLASQVEQIGLALDSGTPADEVLAALCLSRIPAASAVHELARRLDVTHRPETALGLAANPSEEARDRYLGYLAANPELPSPSVLAGLRLVTRDEAMPAGGGQRAADLLIAAARRGRPDHQLAAAIGVAGHPGAVDAVLAELASKPETSAVCHGLLSAARARSGMWTAVGIYHRTASPLMRMLAVRTAGAGSTAASEGFLLHVAHHGSDNAQAMALELLVRQGTPIPEPLLDGLISSPHWRVRLNAALAMSALDPSRGFPVIWQLLTSEDPVERASGTYALAYIRDRRARALLAQLAADPHPIVRRETIASLSRFPGEGGATLLCDLALGPDQPTAMAALEAMIWCACDAEEAARVSSRLGSSLSSCADGDVRARIYRTLGGLARVAPPAELDAALRNLDPSSTIEALGAVDGLILAGVPRAGWGCLDATPADARVRARRSLARMLDGDLDGLESLLELSTDPTARTDALRSLLDLLILVPHLPESDRLARLAKALERGLPPPGAPAPAPAARAREVPDSAATESEEGPPPGSRSQPRLPRDVPSVLARPTGSSRRAGAEARGGYFAPALHRKLRAAGSLAAAVALAATFLGLLGALLHRTVPRRVAVEPPGEVLPAPRASSSPASVAGPSPAPAVATVSPDGTATPLSPHPVIRVPLPPAASLAGLRGFASAAEVSAIGLGPAGIWYAQVREPAKPESLWRWNPGASTATRVESSIVGRGFRMAGESVAFLRAATQGADIVVHPPTGPPAIVTPERFTARELLFAAPDGTWYLLAGGERGERLAHCRARDGRVMPLPLPETCGTPRLVGVRSQQEALISCAGALVRSGFGRERRYRAATGQPARSDGPARPWPALRGPDHFRAHFLILPAGVADAGVRLHSSWGGSPDLPPGSRLVAAAEGVGGEHQFVQYRTGEGTYVNVIAHPEGALPDQVYGAPVTALPVSWPARQALVWKEGAALVLFDGLSREPTRVTTAGPLVPLPGVQNGRSFLLSATQGSDRQVWLLDLVGPERLPRLTPVTGSLPGIPVAALSRSGEDRGIVVVESSARRLDMLVIPFPSASP
jgi:HEAT repeat protein